MKPPSMPYSKSRQLTWRSTWLFVKSAAYAPDHPILSKRLQWCQEPASNQLHFLAMSSCWPSRYETLKVMWGWVIESWFLPLSVLYDTLIAPYIFHPNLPYSITLLEEILHQTKVLWLINVQVQIEVQLMIRCVPMVSTKTRIPWMSCTVSAVQCFRFMFYMLPSWLSGESYGQ
jgi:hypothetical protein